MADMDDSPRMKRSGFLAGAAGAGGLLVGAGLGYAGAQAFEDDEPDTEADGGGTGAAAQDVPEGKNAPWTMKSSTIQARRVL
jgi:hypothetical protein